jgi:hypothetical protein
VDDPVVVTEPEVGPDGVMEWLRTVRVYRQKPESPRASESVPKKK